MLDLGSASRVFICESGVASLKAGVYCVTINDVTSLT